MSLLDLFFPPAPPAPAQVRVVKKAGMDAPVGGYAQLAWKDRPEEYRKRHTELTRLRRAKKKAALTAIPQN